MKANPTLSTDTSTNLSLQDSITEEQKKREADGEHYTMSISRRTVDKLGVKLYDRASAVVAELVANAYDADAEEVRVKLPLATLLGNTSDDETKDVSTNAGGDERTAERDSNTDSEESIVNKVIEVIDDGHGMDPLEADNHFLTVGQDRREEGKQGALSRRKERHVTGRKGIGKLAPFGICKKIEVISAGGEETDQGYLMSHFILDYEEILQDTEAPYYPKRGDSDRCYSRQSGTTIRLSGFLRKRVPDQATFLRQLARRFGARQSDFLILVEDTRDPQSNPIATVDPINIPVVEKTRIDVGEQPVFMEDGTELSVTGWIGMAQQGYKHEELAGVRLYARNKIVGSTRDFGLMSGFTGENTLRSYLVGEVHVEWLDEDDGEDLIKTDRQDILWESARGQALRSWGQDILKEIGTRSRAPRRENVRKRFLKIASIEARARQLFSDESVVQSAMELAEQIGGFAAEDELEDEEYVNGLCDVILTVAPHRALMEAFRKFRTNADTDTPTIASLEDLFDKTSVAELASYSQIAAERVAIIQELRTVVQADVDESELQNLISKAPWLIDPTWSVITVNQSLRTFASGFAALWKQKHGEEISIAIAHNTKRPDFTALEVGGRLRVVEIKAPKHALNKGDFERLQNYVVALREYFDKNESISRAFGNGWQLDLVVDDVALTDESQREAFASYEKNLEVVRVTWEDFVTRAEQANSAFLDVNDSSRRDLAKLDA